MVRESKIVIENSGLARVRRKSDSCVVVFGLYLLYGSHFDFVALFFIFLHMYRSMKKTAKPEPTRVKVNYSVDKDTESKFSEQAERLAINKSALIEKFMAKWTKENEKREA